MFSWRTEGKAISRGSLLRLLVRVIVGVALALLLIVLAAEAWIIPGIIRHRAEQRLSKFCEGRVVIDHAEKKRAGHIALERIRFLDTSGHEWLTVEKAGAVLVDWPNLNPAVDDITVDGLNLKLSVVAGKVVWPPVRLPQRPDGASEAPRIPKFAIRRGAITVTDAAGASRVYGDLSLSILEMGAGQYEFSLSRLTSDSSELLLAKGGVNVRSLDFDLIVQMKHRFTKTEMALPLTGLGAPSISAEGNLFADLSMTGSLSKPEQWQPKGTVLLRNWIVSNDGDVVWSSLGTDLEFKPTELDFGNLSICDSNGVEWFDTEKARLTLANWPGPKPAVTQIELDGPKLRTLVVDGRTFRISTWLPEGRGTDPNAGPSPLQRLVVRDATIAVQDANGPPVVFDRLWVDVARQPGNSYDFTAIRRRPDDSNAIAVKGLVNPASSHVTLSVKADYPADRQETAIAFGAIGIPQYAVEGRIVADLTVAGQLNKPLELQADGSVTLDGCTLFFNKGTLADRLAATAKLSPGHLDVEQYDAALCKGHVSGNFHADANEGKQMAFRGRMLAVNVNFPEFISVVTAKPQDATLGTFTASYDFTGQRNGTSVLNGEGLMFFEDADVSVLPGIPQIFASAGLSQYELLKMSDAEAAFKTAGSVVTIDSGHISNNFAAIEFEPGGTIDLHTRQIDGYVVAAPLSQIAGAFEGLPIINILAHVKDKLMRLHVKGDWADPPGKLITKEPVKDLKESTVGFIQDVVKGGGRLGRGIVDRVGGLFKSNEKKGK